MRTTPTLTAALAALCAALRNMDGDGTVAHAGWIERADSARMLASLCDDAALGCAALARLLRTRGGPGDDRDAAVAASSTSARNSVAAECIAAAVRAVIRDDTADADRLAREALAWLRLGEQTMEVALTVRAFRMLQATMPEMRVPRVGETFAGLDVLRDLAPNGWKADEIEQLAERLHMGGWSLVRDAGQGKA